MAKSPGDAVIRLELAGDPVALAELAADRVGELAGRAVAQRGRCILAVSGGATPAAMFEALAGRHLPWSSIHVFQVDERVAPDGHPDRNLTSLRAHLVRPGSLPAGNLHAMPVTSPDLEEAASRYGEALQAACGGHGGTLDLVHLGLGADGHTASWPPGDPVADETDHDVVVVGPYRGRVRMTLTPGAVNRAERILWLVAGAHKADVLARLVAGDPTLPAARVRQDRAVVLADKAAAHLAAGRYRDEGGGRRRAARGSPGTIVPGHYDDAEANP